MTMLEYDAYKYSADAASLKGTRWAREEEIKQATSRIRLSDPECEIRSGLPVISDGDTIYVDDSDVHSLIIGSTGSKKSRLFAMPMLEIIRRSGESVLVTDPKGELYDKTAQAFEDNGYDVFVINLRDPERSNGWNPLMIARDYYTNGDWERATSIINDFASTMLSGETGGGKNDAFWEHTSKAMLQGLAMMIVEKITLFPNHTVNLATLRHLAENFNQELDSDNPGVLDILEYYPSDSVARMNLLAACGGSEMTFENVKISYNAPMQKLYMQKSLIAMLSQHDIDFSRMGHRKTVIYLIMPDEKTTLHKIVSMVIKLCYEQLIEVAQRCAGNTLPIRVNFLLDEFSNLPAIPDMAAMISAARSRNIKFHLIIQGMYQLSSKYGSDNAQTIKGNCGNWVFLTSRELPLLQEISDLCGEDAQTGEKLISVSQLQRLNKWTGEVLILLGRQFPYLAHLADIGDYFLPANQLRPYPHIVSGQIPIRTIKDVMARIHTQDIEEDTAILDTFTGMFDEHDDNDTSDESTDDPLAMFDLKAELERRYAALFGDDKKETDDGDADNNTDETV